MEVERVVQRIIGKSDFKLSKDVPFSYILRKAQKFIIGKFRGSFRKIGMKFCGKGFFVGKNVKLLSKKKLSLGNHVRIDDNVSIDALSTFGMETGDRVKIGENSKIICSGSLSSLGKGLKIGNDTSFGENAFFGAAGGIKIGNDVIAGQNVRFHAENHNFENKSILIRLQGVKRKGIKVGSNVWIGAGAVFLDGSEVGDGCIVAAGSIVTKKFGNDIVIGGIPAKEIRKRV